MQIIFYVASYGDWTDWIISRWTRGPFSHCEFLFSDGMCFSSSSRDGGTRFKQIELQPKHWDYYSLPVDIQTEHMIRLWCEGEVGKAYDWLGVFGYPLKIQNKNKWFCSEILITALNVNKVTNLPILSPNKFYKELNAITTN